MGYGTGPGLFELFVHAEGKLTVRIIRQRVNMGIDYS